jgi:hypothetical protein
MDWQALHDGLRQWFADVSGVGLTDIAWAGDPVGMRNYPWAELTLLGQAAEPGTDEVRATGLGDDLAIEVVGNRRMTLSCKIVSRDQRPAYRAYAMLEQVRGRLYFPSSQATFRGLGVGLRESLALVDLGRTHDQREESVASLDVAFNWVSVQSDAPVGTIERVVVGGTVKRDPADADPIIIVEHAIP